MQSIQIAKPTNFSQELVAKTCEIRVKLISIKAERPTGKEGPM